ncbi:hypothetical protein [Aeromonas hydrophila]|uniref:hypothetical protein n=1 Tax=Aeromonas hydrophila TaxID=644 RepID=UPI000A58969D|nr:hypothetical protein [Aeromonas hydrophila]
MTFEVGEVHRTAPYLLADLVELYLFLSGEDSISRSDVAELINEGVISAEEIDDIDDYTTDLDTTGAELHSRLDTQLDDLWAHLSYRERNLSDYYPFSIHGQLLIKRELDGLAFNKARVYKSLLACSRLRSFERTMRSRWAKLFAKISKEAMRGLLPENAVVHIFDANSDDRRAIYGTNLREALIVLAQSLAFQYNEITIAEQSASGDYGIDLVGFYQFSDGASGEYYILGQCGAQETEWPSKALESHPASIRGVINMAHDCTNTMFTPVCYRQSSGRWVNARPTGGTLVIDRSRIMKLISNEERLNAIITNESFIDFENEINNVPVA